MVFGGRHRRHPRRIEPGDEYTITDWVDRRKVPPDPEPDFMGEPWGVSDHIPRDRRVEWDEDAQTYKQVGDNGTD